MQVGDLTFIKQLGKGSFGEVFLTQKEGHSQLYATKKIPKSMADAPKTQKYFHNEINLLGKINHKNIMKLIEVKQSKDNYYLVCELCNGGSLNELLDKYRKIHRQPFTEEIVQYLMRQIVDAIKYLHGQHIIHRDLKLDNILMNFDKEQDKQNMNILGAQVKIIDFGFATVLDPQQNLAFSTLGSPINMDPGILKKFTGKDDKGYDEKVDIWSLGTLCYEMLIGKATFAAKTMRELQDKVEKGEYTLPTTLSKEAVSFLNAMLQYDSSYRLSAEELSRHHFLTRDIKQFTKINMNEVKNNLTDDGRLEINVKENKSIWAIFNNGNDLDDVPGYIIEKKDEDNLLAPIAEFDNLNINETPLPNNNNENNNSNSNFNNNQNYNQNSNNFNNNNNQNSNIPNNQYPQQMNNNNNNNNNPNYYYNYNYMKYNNFQANHNPYGFRNNLVNKNMNFQQNNNMNSIKQNHNHQSQNQKADLKEYLKKFFTTINEDFLILEPVFIPLIPGNNPEDKFNDEEHL